MVSKAEYNSHIPLKGSQPAETLVNLRGLGIDDVKLLCLPIRKVVHGFK